MIRYDLELFARGSDCYQDLIERPEGDWVRFDEAMARIAELEAALRSFHKAHLSAIADAQYHAVFPQE